MPRLMSLAAWKIWICPRLHFQKALIPLPCYNMAFYKDNPRNSHDVTPVRQGVPCLATYNFVKSDFFFPFEMLNPFQKMIAIFICIFVLYKILCVSLYRTFVVCVVVFLTFTFLKLLCSIGLGQLHQPSRLQQLPQC